MRKKLCFVLAFLILVLFSPIVLLRNEFVEDVSVRPNISEISSAPPNTTQESGSTILLDAIINNTSTMDEKKQMKELERIEVIREMLEDVILEPASKPGVQPVILNLSVPPRLSIRVPSECRAFNTMVTKQIIYFYLPTPLSTEKNLELIVAMHTWERAGWLPVHVDQTLIADTSLVERLNSRFTEPQLLNTSLWYRWFAMAELGGGFLADNQMINVGFQPRPIPTTSTVYSTSTTLIGATKHGYEEIVNQILQAEFIHALSDYDWILHNHRQQLILESDVVVASFNNFKNTSATQFISFFDSELSGNRGGFLNCLCRGNMMAGMNHTHKYPWLGLSELSLKDLLAEVTFAYEKPTRTLRWTEFFRDAEPGRGARLAEDSWTLITPKRTVPRHLRYRTAEATPAKELWVNPLGVARLILLSPNPRENRYAYGFQPAQPKKHEKKKPIQEDVTCAASFLCSSLMERERGLRRLPSIPPAAAEFRLNPQLLRDEKEKAFEKIPWENMVTFEITNDEDFAYLDAIEQCIRENTQFAPVGEESKCIAACFL